MARKLFAFDLDGTLLDSEKRLSDANREALREMMDTGAVVALASGRLGSSVMRVAQQLGFEPSLLTLNGAAVYAREPSGYRLVYSATLDQQYADHLAQYARDEEFALNFYSDGKLLTVRTNKNAKWIDVYHGQTKTNYEYVPSVDDLLGRPPHKVIFVGDASRLDEEEKRFRDLWDSRVYIVRTWDYYLEFLSLDANKGRGLQALASACGVDMANVVAFGDADNDIPMLEVAGIGIAMSNGNDGAKAVASVVSKWSNDQDGVAREWEELKNGSLPGS